MSTPRYFSNFPNIQYALKVNKAGQPKFINIKDYFHLLTPRDDIFREETLYNKYIIHDGQRPDEIAYQVYGEEQFYWVVLQINEITDYYSQWPLSENELTNFVYKKYGGATGAGETHHWETVPVFDESTPPNRILNGGLVVPQNFIFRYPGTPGGNYTLSSRPVSVSNFQYERDLNDEKAKISILNPKYIYDYVREVKTYAKNLDVQISFKDTSTVSQTY